jgi:acetyl-CoA carboxylase carboxyl transferase subunit alpha
MLEHSIYSVISPGAALRFCGVRPDKVQEATEALRLTAQDLRKFGVIDEIISEPLGGAHRNPQAVIERVGESILKHLKELMPLGVRS